MLDDDRTVINKAKLNLTLLDCQLSSTPQSRECYTLPLVHHDSTLDNDMCRTCPYFLFEYNVKLGTAEIPVVSCLVSRSKHLLEVK